METKQSESLDDRARELRSEIALTEDAAQRHLLKGEIDDYQSLSKEAEGYKKQLEEVIKLQEEAETAKQKFLGTVTGAEKGPDEGKSKRPDTAFERALKKAGSRAFLC